MFLVKSVKHCLKKVVGRAFLSIGEMRASLIVIEETLNNRPLTHVYDVRGYFISIDAFFTNCGRTIATAASDKQYEIISANQALTRREKYHRTLLKQVEQPRELMQTLS
ncbi:Hypothetical predicted protein, partial [Paramuricea clavata]